MKFKNKAFTLAEIMVVFTLIGILTGLIQSNEGKALYKIGNKK